MQISRVLTKILLTLLVFLHYQSIAGLLWSPLSNLKAQVQEYEAEKVLYGERPGQVFIVEDNPLKHACNGFVLRAYLTASHQSEILSEIV